MATFAPRFQGLVELLGAFQAQPADQTASALARGLRIALAGRPSATAGCLGPNAADRKLVEGNERRTAAGTVISVSGAFAKEALALAAVLRCNENYAASLLAYAVEAAPQYAPHGPLTVALLVHHRERGLQLELLGRLFGADGAKLEGARGAAEQLCGSSASFFEHVLGEARRTDAVLTPAGRDAAVSALEPALGGQGAAARTVRFHAENVAQHQQQLAKLALVLAVYGHVSEDGAQVVAAVEACADVVKLEGPLAAYLVATAVYALNPTAAHNGTLILTRPQAQAIQTRIGSKGVRCDAVGRILQWAWVPVAASLPSGHGVTAAAPDAVFHAPLFGAVGAWLAAARTPVALVPGGTDDAKAAGRELPRAPPYAEALLQDSTSVFVQRYVVAFARMHAGAFETFRVYSNAPGGELGSSSLSLGDWGRSLSSESVALSASADRDETRADAASGGEDALVEVLGVVAQAFSGYGDAAAAFWECLGTVALVKIAAERAAPRVLAACWELVRVLVDSPRAARAATRAFFHTRMLATPGLGTPLLSAHVSWEAVLRSAGEFAAGAAGGAAQVLHASLQALATLVRHDESERVRLFDQTQTHRAGERLFALLLRPLPVQLKAAALQALAAFCIPTEQTGSQIGENVWQTLVLVDALGGRRPLPVVSGRAVELGDHGGSGGGLLHDVEFVEASLGEYPVTAAYLELLGSILRALSFGESGGMDGAFTGAMGPQDGRPLWAEQIEFVLWTLVQLQHRPFRAYAERWRLARLALEVLELALCAYGTVVGGDVELTARHPGALALEAILGADGDSSAWNELQAITGVGVDAVNGAPAGMELPACVTAAVAVLQLLVALGPRHVGRRRIHRVPALVFTAPALLAQLALYVDCTTSAVLPVEALELLEQLCAAVPDGFAVAAQVLGDGGAAGRVAAAAAWRLEQLGAADDDGRTDAWWRVAGGGLGARPRMAKAAAFGPAALRSPGAFGAVKMAEAVLVPGRGTARAVAVAVLAAALRDLARSPAGWSLGHVLLAGTPSASGHCALDVMARQLSGGEWAEREPCAGALYAEVLYRALGQSALAAGVSLRLRAATDDGGGVATHVRAALGRVAAAGSALGAAQSSVEVFWARTGWVFAQAHWWLRAAVLELRACQVHGRTALLAQLLEALVSGPAGLVETHSVLQQLRQTRDAVLDGSADSEKGSVDAAGFPAADYSSSGAGLATVRCRAVVATQQLWLAWLSAAEAVAGAPLARALGSTDRVATAAARLVRVAADQLAHAADAGVPARRVPRLWTLAAAHSAPLARLLAASAGDGGAARAALGAAQLLVQALAVADAAEAVLPADARRVAREAALGALRHRDAGVALRGWLYVALVQRLGAADSLAQPLAALVVADAVEAAARWRVVALGTLAAMLAARGGAAAAAADELVRSNALPTLAYNLERDARLAGGLAADDGADGPAAALYAARGTLACLSGAAAVCGADSDVLRHSGLSAVLASSAVVALCERDRPALVGALRALVAALPRPPGRASAEAAARFLVAHQRSLGRLLAGDAASAGSGDRSAVALVVAVFRTVLLGGPRPDDAVFGLLLDDGAALGDGAAAESWDAAFARWAAASAADLRSATVPERAAARGYVLYVAALRRWQRGAVRGAAAGPAAAAAASADQELAWLGGASETCQRGLPVEHPLAASLLQQLS